MTRRERVMRALNFEPLDRPPLDLGAMPSTNISCFAYPGLIHALGLKPRRPRVYDQGQMLALPETDVLDALNCDVVTVQLNLTNAYDQPEIWHPYAFNGRLDAEVLDPSQFTALPDGTIVQPHYGGKMPPGAHVFETDHAGQMFSLTGDIPRPDLDEFRASLKQRALTPEKIAATVAMLKKSRDATDRAIMFWGIGAEIGIANFGGLAMFPMLCMTEPEHVAQLHEIAITHAMEQVERLLPLAADCVDVFMVCPDDWGTQNAPIAAPQMYRELFMPYYKRINGLIHQISPQTRTFFHSCGAIYDMLDDIAESGFDVLNPVQWTAGGHSYSEWKDRTRGRLALWGGGVNTQATLPLGSVEDVGREVHEVVSCLAQDSGYVFCAIHNILAEIAPEKVVAMYRTAGAVRL